MGCGPSSPVVVPPPASTGAQPHVAATTQELQRAGGGNVAEQALLSTIGLDDAVLLQIDPSGLIVYASPSAERLLKFLPSELVGHRFTEHLHPGDTEAVAAALEAGMRQPGGLITIKYRRRVRTGALPRLPAAADAPPDPHSWLLVQLTGHVLGQRHESRGVLAWETAASSATGELAMRGGGSAREGHERIMTYALHELRNALHVLDASAVTVLENAAFASLEPGSGSDGGGGSGAGELSGTGGSGIPKHGGKGGSGVPLLQRDRDRRATAPPSKHQSRNSSLGSDDGEGTPLVISSTGGKPSSSGGTEPFPAGGAALGGPGDGAAAFPGASPAAAAAAPPSSSAPHLQLVRDAMADILLAAKNTSVLVGDILSLQGLRDGTLVPAPEPVSIRALLRDVAIKLRPASRVRIGVIVAPSLPPLLVLDAALVTQIVGNAVSNSMHFSDRGTIYIVASRAANVEAGRLAAGAAGAGRSHPPPVSVVALEEGQAAAPGEEFAGGGGGRGARLSSVSARGRTVVIEVLDCGAGLRGASQAQLQGALAAGQPVEGSRNQRVALYLPIVRQLAEAMGGAVFLSEVSAASPAGGASLLPASVVRFALAAPFTEPSAAESLAVADTLSESGTEEPDFVGASLPPFPYLQATRAGTELFPAPQSLGSSSPAAATARAAPLDAGADAAGQWRGGKPAAAAESAPSPSAAVQRSGSRRSPLSGGQGAGVGALRPAALAGIAEEGGGGGGQPTPSPSPAVPPRDSYRSSAPPPPSTGGTRVVGLDGVPLNMHVMLVDDVRVIRRQGEMFLEALGCTSVTLEDGDLVEGALEAAVRPFDAIIMDIVMHRSDGAEVCRSLREGWNVRCPIIAMTGNTSSKELQRYYAMGFDVVLPKPFTRDSLGRALLEGRERRGGNTRFARQSARGGGLGDQPSTTFDAGDADSIRPPHPAAGLSQRGAAALGGGFGASPAANGPSSTRHLGVGDGQQGEEPERAPIARASSRPDLLPPRRGGGAPAGLPGGSQPVAHAAFAPGALNRSRDDDLI